jgi:hypothetical protein
MKICKIEHTNKGTDSVKIAICLSSDASRGIILKQGEFVLAQEQLTASLDSQTRRGFVKVEHFDNSLLNLNLGEVYSISLLENKSEPVLEKIIEDINVTTVTEIDNDESLSKLEKAEKDASDYINNENED